MSNLHFLDTNILLYSISRDPNETRKREQAITLLDEDGGALSVQVLQEFYVQATRASRPDPIPHAIAASLIHTWMRFAVQDITASILTQALDIRRGSRAWMPAALLRGYGARKRRGGCCDPQSFSLARLAEDRRARRC